MKIFAVLGATIGLTLLVVAVALAYANHHPQVARVLADSLTQNATAPIPTTSFINATNTSNDFRKPVPILMYHYIREAPNNDPQGARLSVASQVFSQQLDAIQAAGYTTITAHQFLDDSLPEHPILLTFDDGYQDFYTEALPALQAHQMVATVFVIYGSLDDTDGRYLTTTQVRNIANAGIEIGSHTVSHPDLTTVDNGKLQDELMASRSALERIVGKRITAIAYPSGAVDERVERYADFTGYQFGVTTEPGIAQRAMDWLRLPRVRVSANQLPDSLISSLAQLVQAVGPTE